MKLLAFLIRGVTVRSARDFLLRILVLLLAPLCLGAVASSCEALPARSDGFVYVGTHPYAAAQPDAASRILRGLYPFDEKLYVGYGIWNHEIAPYDPEVGDFVHEWTAKTAEGCLNYRALGGRLYAPSNQVQSGIDYSVGLPWEDGDVAGGLHLYDMNIDDSGNLWLVGSSGSYAAAWRSEDGGATWDLFLQVAPTIGTFSRFYFVGVYDGRVYLQVIDGPQEGPVDSSLVFDGSSWSNGPDLLPETSQPGNNWGRGLGWRPVVFADRMVYASWGANGNRSFFYAFDGQEAVLSYRLQRIVAFTASDDHLYVLDTNDEVWRTIDLSTWEFVDTAPPRGRSIGVLDRMLYVGTEDSDLYRSDHPVTSVAAGELDSVAETVRIESNLPNPFNPHTTLRYRLAQDGEVYLAVYDVGGALVRVLVSECQTGGGHRVVWDGRDQSRSRVPSGAYFVRLESAGQVRSRKILLVR